MDSVEMARTAYFAMMKEIQDIQDRIVHRAALKEMFGKKAIDPVFRRIGAGVLFYRKQEKHGGVDWDGKDHQRLAELYDTIDAMDDIFERQEEMDMTALAEAFAKAFRQGGRVGT